MTFTPSTHPLWALESDKYYAGWKYKRINFLFELKDKGQIPLLIDLNRNEVFEGFDCIPLSCLYPDWFMSDKDTLASDCAVIINLYGKHSHYFVQVWEMVDWENEALIYRISPGKLEFKRVDRYPISGDGFWIGLKR
jgi:hypothetical protein